MKEVEIAKELGVDAVIYQDLTSLVDCIQHLNPLIKGFDLSVFDGKYVTG